MAREGIEAFYIENNGRFDYDKELPYVVVGVENNLVGRFARKVTAEMFLDLSLGRWGRIIETTVQDAIVGAWGYKDGKALHLPSYHTGLEEGKAIGEAPSLPSVSVPEVHPEPAVDNRPHSRACGFRNHEHGTDCHPNCPTCGGKNT